MARTIQNSTLTVGLLSVPVSLRKVTQRQDVKLDRASPGGNKIKRQEIDSVTGELIEGSVQYGKFDGDVFRAIPQAAIDAIEAETKIEDFTIEHFIPLKDVPFERTMDAYYLAAQTNGGSARPLKLLHEALKRTKKAGVFKLCLTKRQYAAVIYAHNGGLIVNLLAYAADFKQVHEADEAIAGAVVKPEEVKFAVQLIEALAETSDADVIDKLADDLVLLKARLVEEALAGRTIKATAKPAKKPVGGVDVLMESLKASVAEAQRKRPAKKDSASAERVAV